LSEESTVRTERREPSRPFIPAHIVANNQEEIVCKTSRHDCIDSTPQWSPGWRHSCISLERSVGQPVLATNTLCSDEYVSCFNAMSRRFWVLSKDLLL